MFKKKANKPGEASCLCSADDKGRRLTQHPCICKRPDASSLDAGDRLQFRDFTGNSGIMHHLDDIV